MLCSSFTSYFQRQCELELVFRVLRTASGVGALAPRVLSLILFCSVTFGGRAVKRDFPGFGPWRDIRRLGSIHAPHFSPYYEYSTELHIYHFVVCWRSSEGLFMLMTLISSDQLTAICAIPPIEQALFHARSYFRDMFKAWYCTDVVSPYSKCVQSTMFDLPRRSFDQNQCMLSMHQISIQVRSLSSPCY